MRRCHYFSLACSIRALNVPHRFRLPSAQRITWRPITSTQLTTLSRSLADFVEPSPTWEGTRQRLDQTPTPTPWHMLAFQPFVNGLSTFSCSCHKVHRPAIHSCIDGLSFHPAHFLVLPPSLCAGLHPLIYTSKPLMLDCLDGFIGGSPPTQTRPDPFFFAPSTPALGLALSAYPLRSLFSHGNPNTGAPRCFAVDSFCRLPFENHSLRPSRPLLRFCIQPPSNVCAVVSFFIHGLTSVSLPLH